MDIPKIRLSDKTKVQIDPLACIICQKKNAFKYHMEYNCYERYVIISSEKYSETTETLINSTTNNITTDEENDFSTSCGPEISEFQPDSTIESNDMKKIKCIICNNIKNNSVIRKHKISQVESAESFLRITADLKDCVYNRTIGTRTAELILAKGVYYHSNCFRNYQKKYDRKINVTSITPEEICSNIASNVNAEKTNNFCTDDSDSTKNHDEENVKTSRFLEPKNAIIQYIKQIEPNIYNGEAFDLSSVRSAIINKYKYEDNEITNCDIKTALIDYFGEEISFSYPRQKN
ncbi:hypothetical protein KQX54_013579 [Cotesia glomerata]|uniref:Uncharacterized protein n=1 Tax=Cotesia glomerata TaxID=32391 RepID=A0AAV7IXV1_COTGL|nr:hypothetical protein KQX54_013579 [Cotesia glomerata]